MNDREFGRLESDVKAVQAQVAALEKKVDTLIALANQGQGGIRALWAVGGAVAAVLAFVGFDRIFKG